MYFSYDTDEVQMHKYTIVAEWIKSSISEGTFKPGDKIPSLRHLQKQFSVALSVVVQACRNLEEIGLIESKEKSGFFVSINNENAITKIPTQKSFKANIPEAHSLIGKIIEFGLDPDLPPFAAGVPSPEILPIKKINQSINYLIKNEPSLIANYAPSKGSLNLREHLASRFSLKGVKVKANELLITNGAIEALSIAIKASSKIGDTIALESPVFFGLIPILKELKRKFIEVPCSPETGLDIEAFTKLLSKKKISTLIISGTIQNPLGAILTEQKKKTLIDLSSEYDFKIIEDNVYGECGYDKEILFPIKKYDKNDRVIYVSSLSKCSAPGLRVGWMIPGGLMEKCEHIKTSQTLGNSLLIQEATARFMETGGYKFYLKKFRESIKQQVLSTRHLVLKYFPEGTRVSQPQGGFFLWIELPLDLNLNTELLFKKALKNKLTYVPGTVFTQTHQFDSYLRISCTHPVNSEVEESLYQLGLFFKKNGKK
jgi:DNA-binding transcriptional MocR family regulator